MSQLKRYNGTSWEVVGGSIAPKTTQTNSDTDTYSCNYVNDLTTPVFYNITDTPAHSAGTNGIYILKVGNIIIANLYLWINSITAYTWIELGTLPASIVPTYNISASGTVVNGNNGNMVGSGLVDINNNKLRIKPDVTLSSLCAVRINAVWTL